MNRDTSLSLRGQTVVGIDVGGERKGFHAVALRARVFETKTSTRHAEIVDWCRNRAATAVAVDAPCGWSRGSGSRQAERELTLNGTKIHCFATPTREVAAGNPFYDWVFNGEKLYQCLSHYYRCFDGVRRAGSVYFETFPHGVVCARSGRVVSAKPKASTRRQLLRDCGYDDRALPNIDFVDAALCAIAAEAFREGRTRQFGWKDEGLIVVPACEVRA